MTPKRSEPESDNDVHGVLGDAENLDTAGIGLLGTATAQVDVSFPSSSADDDADDDVIGDEVAFTPDFTDTAEAEIVDEVHAESSEDLVASDADDVHDDVVDAEDVDADDVHEAQAAETGQPRPKTTEKWLVELGIASESKPASGRKPKTATVSHPEPADAAEEKPVTKDAATDRPKVSESIPEPRRVARAVERVPASRDVSLTSKRLDEFEVGRESADLLTLDRLLDPHQIVKSEPEGLWQQFVYSLSGRKINLGDSKRVRARKELDRRIAAPLPGGARFVPVLSRKGGVGKTTVTTLLGMALADARDDRVIAVDANPDRGTLAERIARTSGKTVRDLVRNHADVAGYSDISGIVSRDETRLDILASDTDARVSEAFNAEDYREVATVAEHYYSIVLTDTGTGIVHSVMGATLETADQIVVVSGLSVDEARLASETLTWLETNGYAEKVQSAVVVLNNARPGAPLVQEDELETHFRSRVRAVVRVPYDAHVAAGSAITFRDLQPETRQAARELAAAVVEGLRVMSLAV